MSINVEIRQRVGRALDALLATLEPKYTRVKIRSDYLWPGELVWRRDTDAMSRFIVFSLSDKNVGQATLYLCWSRLHRFPEQSIRPWFGAQFDFARDREAPEGSVFLSAAAPEFPQWSMFTRDDPGQRSLEAAIAALRDQGLPFLERLG